MDLVLFAFENGKGGDIFIQKSPAAVNKDISNCLKKILGFKIMRLRPLELDMEKNYLKIC